MRDDIFKSSLRKMRTDQNYVNRRDGKSIFGALEYDASDPIRVIILTDCSNARAAVHSVQTRFTDKSVKILLGDIRDSQFLTYFFQFSDS